MELSFVGNPNPRHAYKKCVPSLPKDHSWPILVAHATMSICISNIYDRSPNTRICVDFKKFNKATKKDPYPLPFFDEVLNTVIRYEPYSFLDGYSSYHQISIALEDRYKTTFITNWRAFVLMVM
jgi:hypothetical protein